MSTDDVLHVPSAPGSTWSTTNLSESIPGVPTPLENAGLAEFFERQFSVDAWRVFKPAPQLYTGVAAALRVAAE